MFVRDGCTRIVVAVRTGFGHAPAYTAGTDLIWEREDAGWA
jgi:hypothetical protein